jgi:hypothetical protein
MDSSPRDVYTAEITNGMVQRWPLLSPRDATAFIYELLSELPHFNPDDDREPLHLAVAR